MTLTQTLQLKERFLQYNDLRALDYCEKRWREAGEPTERWEVINFLERMLCELKNQGGYPKVLLLRKKELQRRTFTLSEPAQELEQAECSCFEGWLPSGKPCPCPKGEPHRKQLRAWGMQIWLRSSPYPRAWFAVAMPRVTSAWVEWLLRKLAHEGKLPYVQITDRSPMLFDRADLRAWIERQKIRK